MQAGPGTYLFHYMIIRILSAEMIKTPDMSLSRMNVHYTFLLTDDDSIAEVFYYVNYVNVNYSVKNSTVDCKYLLYFL